MVDRSVSARHRRLVTLFLVGALAMGAAACGGDDDSASSTTSVPRSSTTSTDDTSTSSAPASDDAAVRAGYDAANRAFIEAAAIPDPEFPAVAATHTGPMLDQRREVLRALEVDGRVIRYPANSQYRVVVETITTTDGVARLRFCAVDDAERVDTRTGDVISAGVVTVRGEAAMRLDGGAWRLAEQRFDSRDEGSASCD